ncbi:MAG: hypothetical protein V3T05_07760, partial [Myxococcota bacterium]
MSRPDGRRLVPLIFLPLAFACTDKRSNRAVSGDVGPLPQQWHFEPVPHGQGDMTLTDVWGRSDGAVFVVGWYGTIFSNRVTPRNPNGNWASMVSGTVEHLT